MGIEKTSPLGWLRRRGREKFERGKTENFERMWRIVDLGQVCPWCAVPLEVSFESNLTWYRCPGCRWRWAIGVGRKIRAHNRGVSVKRVNRLSFALQNFLVGRTNWREGTLATMLATKRLIERFGLPVSRETYRKILGRMGLRDPAPGEEETGAAGPRESGEPEVMYA